MRCVEGGQGARAPLSRARTLPTLDAAPWLAQNPRPSSLGRGHAPHARRATRILRGPRRAGNSIPHALRLRRRRGGGRGRPRGQREGARCARAGLRPAFVQPRVVDRLSLLRFASRAAAFPGADPASRSTGVGGSGAPMVGAADQAANDVGRSIDRRARTPAGVRIPEAPGLRLLEEARPALGVGRAMSGERLERHQAVEPRGAPIMACGSRSVGRLALAEPTPPEESYAASSSLPNLSSGQSSA